MNDGNLNGGMVGAFDKAWGVVKNDPMDADDFYDRLKDSLEAGIIDDGTMDTVVAVNDKEYRFTNDSDEEFHPYEYREQCMENAKEMYIQDFIDENLGYGGDFNSLTGLPQAMSRTEEEIEMDYEDWLDEKFADEG